MLAIKDASLDLTGKKPSDAANKDFWLTSSNPATGKGYYLNTTENGKIAAANTTTPTVEMNLKVYGLTQPGAWKQGDKFAVRPTFMVSTSDPNPAP